MFTGAPASYTSYFNAKSIDIVQKSQPLTPLGFINCYKISFPVCSNGTTILSYHEKL